MEVHFSSDLEARLNHAAQESERDPDVYVQELVENYLDHDTWFRQKVTASLGRLDRGEFVTNEEVAAHLEKMFRS